MLDAALDLLFTITFFSSTSQMSPVTDLVVYLGILNVPDDKSDLQPYFVQSTFIYTDYNKSLPSPTDFQNDMALVQIAAPAVTFTDIIRPICLPPTDVDLTKFKVCVATGWGHTAFAGTEC